MVGRSDFNTFAALIFTYDTKESALQPGTEAKSNIKS